MKFFKITAFLILIVNLCYAAELPLVDGIPRFKANEDRVNSYVNTLDPYTTNTDPPASVESIRAFMIRKETELDAYSTAANGETLVEDEAGLNAAISSGSVTSIVLLGSFSMTGNITFTKPVKIKPGAIVTTTGHTLATAGYLVSNNALAQIFTGTGTITGLKEARPEWFGAIADDSTDCLTALQNASSAVGGGTVLLGYGKYKISAAWRTASQIRGMGPLNSIIHNTGTGDALDIGPGGYYYNYEDFSVEGNASSRDGITTYTTAGDNNSYSHVRNVYSYSNGRHGLYHRKAWGTRYENCKFGMENGGNGGLGVFMDSIVADGAGANGVTFLDCDSRYNGGTSTSTTYADDKGGVRVNGGAGVHWIGGVIERNNAWGFMVTPTVGGVASTDILISPAYMEGNPSYATSGGNIRTSGPWANVVARNIWMAYGGPSSGKTGYAFDITGGNGLVCTTFKEYENQFNALGAGGTDTIYSAASKSCEPPVTMTSLMFGDMAGSGSPTTTDIVTITADGMWTLAGTIHFRRLSDNAGTILPFQVVFPSYSSSSRYVSVGSSIAGTSTQSPTLAFSGDTLQLTTPAYCYANIEINDGGIQDSPTTLLYNWFIFGNYGANPRMRRR